MSEDTPAPEVQEAPKAVKVKAQASKRAPQPETDLELSPLAEGDNTPVQPRLGTPKAVVDLGNGTTIEHY